MKRTRKDLLKNIDIDYLLSNSQAMDKIIFSIETMEVKKFDKKNLRIIKNGNS